MPLLLYRYILRDLLRVFFLTTTILVLVIAFGAAIRPLAEEQILGPIQMVVYVTLAMVPMLQFALPFAAGFAATMAFHRLANDNELVAIAVGGISYPRIIMPVVALGVLLFAIMVGLTQWVIPTFWGLMEHTITREVTDIFQNRIKSGQPFAMNDTQIYADQIIPQTNPPDTGADSRLVLVGVVAAELDEQKRVTTDITASRAAIDVYHRSGQTYLKLILFDTAVFKHETGELIRTPRVEPEAIVIPSVFRTDEQSKTRGQLLELRRNPGLHTTVFKLKMRLATLLENHEIWKTLDAEFKAHGSVSFPDGSAAGISYQIQADGIRNGIVQRSDGEHVVITKWAGQEPQRQFVNGHVQLLRGTSSVAGQTTFEIQMSDVGIREYGQEQPSNFRKFNVVNVVSPVAFSDLPPAEQALADVIEQARLIESSDANVESSLGRLEYRIQQLNWEISSRLLKRYSFSTTALILLVLGGIIAIWLRDTQPLTIYTLAFLPSILDLILISSGEQMMNDGEVTPGFIVMWSGNATLVLICGYVFSRLRRN